MESWLPFFPEQASTIAPRVDGLYLYLVAISLFFGTLIFFLVIYFAIKYRRRSEDDPPPPPVADYLPLEITWIIVPLILAMIAFFWGILWKFSSSDASGCGSSSIPTAKGRSTRCMCRSAVRSN
jgi:heme/copper-type cytochrome/quinol oxidase subunit 2